MTVPTRSVAGLAAVTLALSLTACERDDTAAPSTAPSGTITTTTTSTTTTSTTPQASESTPAPVAEEPGVEEPAAPIAPYVTECLPGTPGPAMWSDGVMRPADECSNPAAAQAEGDATEQYWRDHPDELPQPTGGDQSTWDYDGPHTENGDPADHPQLNWPEE